MPVLRLRRATEADIRGFRTWRYPAPYDVYDLGDDRLEDSVAYFLQDHVSCHVLVDDADVVVGFCTFGRDGQVPGGDYTQPGLDIGLGIRPDLTGRGRGADWIEAACRFASEQFDPVRLRVTIAAWNGRALSAWRTAGFRAVQQFRRARGSGGEFIVLERGVAPPTVPRSSS